MQYQYVVDRGDRIVLMSTKDVLDIPEDAEIVSDIEASEMFPRNDVIEHNVTFGKFSGEYITSGAYRSVLFKAKELEDRFIEIEESRYNQLNNITFENDINKNYIHRSVSFSDSRYHNMYSSLADIEHRYENYDLNHPKNKRILALKSRTASKLSDPIDKFINSIYPKLSDVVDIKESTEQIINKLKASITESKSYRSDCSYVNVLTKDNVLLIISMAGHGRENKIEALEHCTVSVECFTDLSKAIKELQNELPKTLLLSIKRNASQTITALAKSIILPDTTLLNKDIIMKPADNTKAGKFRFLKAITDLKLYNFRAAVKKCIDEFSVSHCQRHNTGYDCTDNLRSMLWYTNHIYASGQLPFAVSIIDEQYKVSKSINEQIEKELKAKFTKKEIRKKLFAAIRKELYYTAKTGKK